RVTSPRRRLTPPDPDPRRPHGESGDHVRCLRRTRGRGPPDQGPTRPPGAARKPLGPLRILPRRGPRMPSHTPPPALPAPPPRRRGLTSPFNQSTIHHPRKETANLRAGQSTGRSTPMALVYRNGRPYLYRSVRRDGRVTSEYRGSGEVAELMSA